MKINKFLLFSFLSLFVLMPIKTHAFENTTEKEKLNSEDIEFAKKAVIQYYKNRDLGENNALDSYFSKDVLKLINYKIMYKNYKNKELDISYSKYNVIVKPVDIEKWVKKGNTLSFSLQVITRFFYMNSDVESEESIVLEITVSKDKQGNILITRCSQSLYSDVDEIKYYDMLSKKENVDKWLMDNFEVSKNEIEEAKKSKEEDLKEYKYDVKNDIETFGINTSFDRQSIANWARNNYDRIYPSSSSSYVPYYDFSSISGNYDCTNFVSHALLAGGFSMNDKGYSGIQGTNQWYFRSIKNRSTSWSGVSQLYVFLTRKSNLFTGPSATEKKFSYNNSYLGDVIQVYYRGSGWGHSVIVTKFRNGIVLVTGRTAPNWYNNNIEARGMGSSQRLLHLEHR